MLAADCNDAQQRIAPPEITDLAARWRSTYPLFGGAAAAGLAVCASWPTGGTAPEPATPAGLPPVLVIGTAADPNGPQDGARGAADAVPSGVYLAWQGAGTGAFPRTACITGLVDRMLVDGSLPGSDIACPP